MLPERDRLMVRLFYQEMLSQKQISEQLHIPEGTVKSRMSTAKAHFRTVYPYPPQGGMKMKNTALSMNILKDCERICVKQRIRIRLHSLSMLAA